MTIHTVRATCPAETWAVIDCDAADCVNFQTFDTLTDDDVPTASIHDTTAAAHAEGWQTVLGRNAVDLCPVHADGPGFAHDEKG